MPHDDPPPSDSERPLSARQRLDSIPDMDDAAFDGSWDAPGARQRTTADEEPEKKVDQRRFRIGGSSTADLPPAGPSPTATPGPDHSGADLGFEPEVAEGEEPRRRRRRGPWIAAAIAIPLLAIVGLWTYAWIQWNRIDRVDTDSALSGGSSGFTNYLIVGTDSREGIDPDLETAGSIGLDVAGSRSDTMVILHVGDDGNRLMSLPRDLWVEIDGGGSDKLNAATVLGGAPTLIRTVQSALGVPVHRYLEVDIAGFMEVVRSLGSITIDFPRPACDPKSGLMIRRGGATELGPQRALAYVRSRTYTEFRARDVAAGATCDQIIGAGLGSTVGVSDFGRTERQRKFLLAVFDRIGSTNNPLTLMTVLSGLTDGLRVDDDMGMTDAFGLMRKLRGLDAETVILPVTDFNPGGTSALTLTEPADDVLDGFR